MNDLSMTVAGKITKLAVVSTVIFVILKISGVGNWKHWDWKFAFYPIVFWFGFILAVVVIGILHSLVLHGLVTYVIPFLEKKIYRKPLIIHSIFGKE